MLMTDTTPYPMAMPGSTAISDAVLATALAVIEAVPKPDIMLRRISFPSWNMLFSMPLGTPILNIFFMRLQSGMRTNFLLRWTFRS